MGSLKSLYDDNLSRELADSTKNMNVQSGTSAKRIFQRNGLLTAREEGMKADGVFAASANATQALRRAPIILLL